MLRNKMCIVYERPFFLSLERIIMLDVISIRMSFISINRKAKTEKRRKFLLILSLFYINMIEFFRQEGFFQR